MVRGREHNQRTPILNFVLPGFDSLLLMVLLRREGKARGQ